MSDEILKPYPNEHACRIREPGEFEPNSLRRIKQGRLSMIMGRLKGEKTMTLAAYRYPKAQWTEAEARAHCAKAGGQFHAATTGKMAFTKELIAKANLIMSQIQKARASLNDLIEKGWLPAGMTQNDLDDGDFAWLSDAYKRGEEPKSKGRKLPYKIHGKVNSQGWRAAMAGCQGARGQMSFAGGPSKAQVERKLCRDKPKEINSQICENLGKEDAHGFRMVRRFLARLKEK